MYIDITAKKYYDEEETPTALFPNPARSEVTVQAEGMTQVRIINLLGQVMKEVQVNAANSIVINTEKMERGVYLVEITTINEVVIKQLVLAKH